jgi:hypothetical protein
MSISICDYTHYLVIASLVIAGLSVFLTWFRFERWGITCIAISLLIQGMVAFQPNCASIIDLRGVPVVGQPAH